MTCPPISHAEVAPSSWATSLGFSELRKKFSLLEEELEDEPSGAKEEDFSPGFGPPDEEEDEDSSELLADFLLNSSQGLRSGAVSGTTTRPVSVSMFTSPAESSLLRKNRPSILCKSY